MCPATPKEMICEAVRALAALDLAAACGWRPADLRAWRCAGMQRLRDGQSVAAAEILDYACFLDVASAATWETAAVARLAAGRPQAAALAIEIARAIEPSWQRAAIAALCREALGDTAGTALCVAEARQLAMEEPAAAASLDRVFGRREEGE